MQPIQPAPYRIYYSIVLPYLRVLLLEIDFLSFISRWLVSTREDGAIESAVPLSAPEPGGNLGATSFTPGRFIDAMPPEYPGV